MTQFIARCTSYQVLVHIETNKEGSHREGTHSVKVLVYESVVDPPKQDNNVYIDISKITWFCF